MLVMFVIEMWLFCS